MDVFSSTIQFEGCFPGYQQFCDSDAWLEFHEPRPYCQPGGPSLYSFIQSQYWGVGLFKYYQLKQVCLEVRLHKAKAGIAIVSMSFILLQSAEGAHTPSTPTVRRVNASHCETFGMQQSLVSCKLMLCVLRK